MPEVNRHTARVLLFDHEDRILLFLTTAPDTSGVARWITPGGGVDPGESAEEGAIRELFEETGLRVETLGNPVWSHDFRVQWDAADHDTGHADFFAHLAMNAVFDRLARLDEARQRTVHGGRKTIGACKQEFPPSRHQHHHRRRHARIDHIPAGRALLGAFASLVARR